MMKYRWKWQRNANSGIYIQCWNFNKIAKMPAEFTLCWLSYFLLKVAYHTFSYEKYFKSTSSLWILITYDDALENISNALHVNKDYLKEPASPYTEHDLMRFLFKLDDSIEVNIRQVIMNDEDSAYTTTGIYFGSEAILRIRNMLEDSTL